jgi:hypothetical protein
MKHILSTGMADRTTRCQKPSMVRQCLLPGLTCRLRRHKCFCGSLLLMMINTA